MDKLTAKLIVNLYDRVNGVSKIQAAFLETAGKEMETTRLVLKQVVHACVLDDGESAREALAALESAIEKSPRAYSPDVFIGSAKENDDLDAAIEELKKSLGMGEPG